jgi:zinc transport system substrate-binding protein
MKSKFFILAILIAFFVAGCQPATVTEPSSEAPIVVFTSIVPQQYFVNRIAGDLVEAIVMVEPGASPATYEPKPSQMAALADAELYFSIGVPFEATWLEKIAATNTDMVIVDTTVGIEKRVMTEPHTHEGEEHVGEEHEGEEHEEGDHDDHDHEEGAFDPHVWVSPALVKIQAQTIFDALVKIAPEHEETFQQNLDTFIVDIEALEADIDSSLSGLSSKKFMVFHPSWGYFADEFGLEQIAIEVGGTEPSAAELAELIEEAEHEGIKVVFAQPEFSTQDASTVAQAIGGEVILISPLAYNWLENLQNVASTFAEVLE